MYIKGHAHCCGIKVFYLGGSGVYPDADLAARREVSGEYSPTGGWKAGKAKKRLKDMVDWMKKHQPSSLAEVSITQSQKNGGKHTAWSEKAGTYVAKEHDGWEKTLDKLGFKLVAVFKNGNSPNTVYVYHLVLKDGKPVDPMEQMPK